MLQFSIPHFRKLQNSLFFSCICKSSATSSCPKKATDELPKDFSFQNSLFSNFFVNLHP